MTSDAASSDEPGEAHRAALLQVVIAIAGVCLIAATWRWWWPPSGFPRVPLLAAAAGASETADTVCAMAIAAGLSWVVVTLIASRPRRPGLARFGWFIFLAGAIGAVVLDQHRWQPWLWQFVVLGLVFVLAAPGRALRLARWMTIALYVHSALGKLDHSFLTTNGPMLVDGLLANFGAALPAEGAVRWGSALALPAGELIVALLLCGRRTRPLGLIGSIAMHAALMAALGPWGLDHQPGVLLWNVYFIVQNLLLFGRTNAPATQTGAVPSMPWSARDRAAAVLVGSVVLIPILEPFDRLDPWLGWGLYASRPGRMRLSVTEAGANRLPAELQPFVEPAAFDGWRRVRLDRWSLAATGAPLAPQPRFSLGVALALVRRFELDDDARVELESSANRRTGRRVRRVATGSEAIEREAEQFTWNCQPRAADVAR